MLRNVNESWHRDFAESGSERGVFRYRKPSVRDVLSHPDAVSMGHVSRLARAEFALLTGLCSASGTGGH